MRKYAAYWPALLCLLCLLGFGIWTAICVNDYRAFLAIPAKSGADHFMIGMLYAIGFFLLSSIGIPAGIACLKRSAHCWGRVFGAVTLAASCLFLPVAARLFWI